MEEVIARRLMAAVRVARRDTGWAIEVTAGGIRVLYRWTSDTTGNLYTAEGSTTWESIKLDWSNSVLQAMDKVRAQKERILDDEDQPTA